MKKLSMAFAALTLLSVSSAFANFVPGRVDTVVSCSTTLVNGYSIQITSTEGTPQYIANIYHGGVVGNTQIAGPIEVKMTTKGQKTTIVDTRSAGEYFKLVIDQQLNPQPQNSNVFTFVPNSKAKLNLQLASEPSLPLYCSFPVHIM